MRMGHSFRHVLVTLDENNQPSQWKCIYCPDVENSVHDIGEHLKCHEEEFGFRGDKIQLLLNVSRLCVGEWVGVRSTSLEYNCQPTSSALTEDGCHDDEPLESNCQNLDDPESRPKTRRATQPVPTSRNIKGHKTRHNDQPSEEPKRTRSNNKTCRGNNKTSVVDKHGSVEPPSGDRPVKRRGRGRPKSKVVPSGTQLKDRQVVEPNPKTGEHIVLPVQQPPRDHTECTEVVKGLKRHCTEQVRRKPSMGDNGMVSEAYCIKQCSVALRDILHQRTRIKGDCISSGDEGFYSSKNEEWSEIHTSIKQERNHLSSEPGGECRVLGVILDISLNSERIRESRSLSKVSEASSDSVFGGRSDASVSCYNCSETDDTSSEVEVDIPATCDVKYPSNSQLCLIESCFSMSNGVKDEIAIHHDVEDEIVAVSDVDGGWMSISMHSEKPIEKKTVDNGSCQQDTCLCKVKYAMSGHTLERCDNSNCFLFTDCDENCDGSNNFGSGIPVEYQWISQELQKACCDTESLRKAGSGPEDNVTNNNCLDGTACDVVHLYNELHGQSTNGSHGTEDVDQKDNNESHVYCTNMSHDAEDVDQSANNESHGQSTNGSHDAEDVDQRDNNKSHGQCTNGSHGTEDVDQRENNESHCHCTNISHNAEDVDQRYVNKSLGQYTNGSHDTEDVDQRDNNESHGQCTNGSHDAEDVDQRDDKESHGQCTNGSHDTEDVDRRANNESHGQCRNGLHGTEDVDQRENNKSHGECTNGSHDAEVVDQRYVNESHGQYTNGSHDAEDLVKEIKSEDLPSKLSEDRVRVAGHVKESSCVSTISKKNTLCSELCDQPLLVCQSLPSADINGKVSTDETMLPNLNAKELSMPSVAVRDGGDTPEQNAMKMSAVQMSLSESVHVSFDVQVSSANSTKKPSDVSLSDSATCSPGLSSDVPVSSAKGIEKSFFVSTSYARSQVASSSYAPVSSDQSPKELSVLPVESAATSSSDAVVTFAPKMSTQPANVPELPCENKTELSRISVLPDGCAIETPNLPLLQGENATKELSKEPVMLNVHVLPTEGTTPSLSVEQVLLQRDTIDSSNMPMQNPHPMKESNTLGGPTESTIGSSIVQVLPVGSVLTTCREPIVQDMCVPDVTDETITVPCPIPLVQESVLEICNVPVLQDISATERCDVSVLQDESATGICNVSQLQDESTTEICHIPVLQDESATEICDVPVLPNDEATEICHIPVTQDESATEICDVPVLQDESATDICNVLILQDESATDICDVPVLQDDSATEMCDVLVLLNDEATEICDVPVLQDESATEICDVPVLPNDEATEMCHVPVLQDDSATEMCHVPVLQDESATDICDVPVLQDDSATEMCDVLVLLNDEATEICDVPVLQDESATEICDVPVLPNDEATEMCHVPVLQDDSATEMCHVPVLQDESATEMCHVPVLQDDSATEMCHVPVLQDESATYIYDMPVLQDESATQICNVPVQGGSATEIYNNTVLTVPIFPDKSIPVGANEYTTENVNVPVLQDERATEICNSQEFQDESATEICSLQEFQDESTTDINDVPKMLPDEEGKSETSTMMEVLPDESAPTMSNILVLPDGSTMEISTDDSVFFLSDENATEGYDITVLEVDGNTDMSNILVLPTEGDTDMSNVVLLSNDVAKDDTLLLTESASEVCNLPVLPAECTTDTSSVPLLQEDDSIPVASIAKATEIGNSPSLTSKSGTEPTQLSVLSAESTTELSIDFVLQNESLAVVSDDTPTETSKTSRNMSDIPALLTKGHTKYTTVSAESTTEISARPLLQDKGSPFVSDEGLTETCNVLWSSVKSTKESTYNVSESLAMSLSTVHVGSSDVPKSLGESAKLSTNLPVSPTNGPNESSDIPGANGKESTDIPVISVTNGKESTDVPALLTTGAKDSTDVLVSCATGNEFTDLTAGSTKESTYLPTASGKKSTDTPNASTKEPTNALDTSVIESNKVLAASTKESSDVPATSTNKSTNVPVANAKESIKLPAASDKEPTNVPCPSTKESTNVPCLSAKESTNVPCPSTKESTNVPCPGAKESTNVPCPSAKESTNVPCPSTKESTNVPCPSAKESTNVSCHCANESTKLTVASAKESTDIPIASAKESSKVPCPSTKESYDEPAISTKKSTNIPVASGKEPTHTPNGSTKESTNIPLASAKELSKVPVAIVKVSSKVPCPGAKESSDVPVLENASPKSIDPSSGLKSPHTQKGFCNVSIPLNAKEAPAAPPSPVSEVALLPVHFEDFVSPVECAKGSELPASVPERIREDEAKTKQAIAGRGTKQLSRLPKSNLMQDQSFKMSFSVAVTNDQCSSEVSKIVVKDSKQYKLKECQVVLNDILRDDATAAATTSGESFTRKLLSVGHRRNICKASRKRMAVEQTKTKVRHDSSISGVILHISESGSKGFNGCADTWFDDCLKNLQSPQCSKEGGVVVQGEFPDRVDKGNEVQSRNGSTKSLCARPADHTSESREACLRVPLPKVMGEDIAGYKSTDVPVLGNGSLSVCNKNEPCVEPEKSLNTSMEVVTEEISDDQSVDGSKNSKSHNQCTNMPHDVSNSSRLHDKTTYHLPHASNNSKSHDQSSCVSHDVINSNLSQDRSRNKSPDASHSNGSLYLCTNTHEQLTYLPVDRPEKSTSHDKYTAPVLESSQSHNKCRTPVVEVLESSQSHDKCTKLVLESSQSHDKCIKSVLESSQSHDKCIKSVLESSQSHDKLTKLPSDYLVSKTTQNCCTHESIELQARSSKPQMRANPALDRLIRRTQAHLSVELPHDGLVCNKTNGVTKEPSESPVLSKNPQQIEQSLPLVSEPVTNQSEDNKGAKSCTVCMENQDLGDVTPTVSAVSQKMTTTKGNVNSNNNSNEPSILPVVPRKRRKLDRSQIRRISHSPAPRRDGDTDIWEVVQIEPKVSGDGSNRTAVENSHQNMQRVAKGNSVILADVVNGLKKERNIQKRPSKRKSSAVKKKAGQGKGSVKNHGKAVVKKKRQTLKTTKKGLSTDVYKNYVTNYVGEVKASDTLGRYAAIKNAIRSGQWLYHKKTGAMTNSKASKTSATTKFHLTSGNSAMKKYRQLSKTKKYSKKKVTTTPSSEAPKKKRKREPKFEFDKEYSGDVVWYKCTWCTYKTLYYQALVRHRRRHTGKIACDQCDKGFDSNYELKIHKRVAHEKKLLACQDCGKTFTSRNGLHSHKLAVHLKQRRFKCEYCDHEGFSNRGHYMGHLNKCHYKVNPYSCDKCGKGFTYKSYIKRHEKICAGFFQTESAEVECSMCGITFTTKSQLTVHLKYKHTTERAFTCPCGKSYKWAASIYRHKKECQVVLNEKSGKAVLNRENYEGMCKLYVHGAQVRKPAPMAVETTTTVNENNQSSNSPSKPIRKRQKRNKNTTGEDSRKKTKEKKSSENNTKEQKSCENTTKQKRSYKKNKEKMTSEPAKQKRSYKKKNEAKGGETAKQKRTSENTKPKKICKITKEKKKCEKAKPRKSCKDTKEKTTKKNPTTRKRRKASKRSGNYSDISEEPMAEETGGFPPPQEPSFIDFSSMYVTEYNLKSVQRYYMASERELHPPNMTLGQDMRSLTDVSFSRTDTGKVLGTTDPLGMDHLSYSSYHQVKPSVVPVTYEAISDTEDNAAADIISRAARKCMINSSTEDYATTGVILKDTGSLNLNTDHFQGETTTIDLLDIAESSQIAAGGLAQNRGKKNAMVTDYIPIMSPISSVMMEHVMDSQKDQLKVLSHYDTEHLQVDALLDKDPNNLAAASAGIIIPEKQMSDVRSDDFSMSLFSPLFDHDNEDEEGVTAAAANSLFTSVPSSSKDGKAISKLESYLSRHDRSAIRGKRLPGFDYTEAETTPEQTMTSIVQPSGDIVSKYPQVYSSAAAESVMNSDNPSPSSAIFGGATDEDLQSFIANTEGFALASEEMARSPLTAVGLSQGKTASAIELPFYASSVLNAANEESATNVALTFPEDADNAAAQLQLPLSDALSDPYLDSATIESSMTPFQEDILNEVCGFGSNPDRKSLKDDAIADFLQ